MADVKMVEKDFLTYVQKMENYGEALALLAWDSRTGAPKKGIEQRSQVIGTLSTEVFKQSTSDQMAEFLQTLNNDEARHHLSEITTKTLDECQKEFDRNSKIPEEEYKEFVILQSKAEAAWEEAKEKADFSAFQPYLEKIVETIKRFIDYWGYEGNKYNTLLDDYEPGVTVDILDDVFGKLRDQLIPLVKGVTESKQPKTDFLFERFPKEQQRAFSLDILRQMNYDFNAGRLDETVHPFAIGLNPNDVRVTTKYDENDFRTAVFGTIHEGGHALYEQNISESLIGTPLADGTSMGIHESQSLFWENFVGRHPGFWEHNYERLKTHANGQFDQVSKDEFYQAINVAGPSLIRIEADELTYALHIIIRYEIEKALINDEIEVKDLPEIWNNKMEEYLGIRPSHDGEGVLQDVHWSDGSFGYFPSYALGYIYAAQLQAAMKKDLPNYDQLITDGNLTPLQEWLTNHVHQFGKLKTPVEILKDITGEGINPDDLVQYLSEKYRNLYQF
ncbi:carboxypeptidase M32 [Desertibacillus haloalkaliphilus]|uniref:carboxypeptidase M32 n=1 Tax=Desertibacillus haloalkaliphilus TaxID=1328930 RepID=UPI001C2789AB|nr:carboxypeptidase M32 [Desertibacillus haloalkaliphilus]MBU8906071.1 carboxypeptidase M32 [Desertibacillus haloalkaliphilus]